MTLSRPVAAACLAVVAALTLALPAEAAGKGSPLQRTWDGEQARIYAPQAAGHGGRGVVVAVVDSWVDAAHPDFQGRVLAGADCVGGCSAGPAPTDACTHGTHVAGTVASSSFGVAPLATVLPVRVLSYDARTRECVGRPEDVAAGIRWASAHGARVINLSLGTDLPGIRSTTAIGPAVDAAAAAGVVVVFSAGNSTGPLTDTYGGQALIVAATGPSGRLASYSQRGAAISLAAPGGEPATSGPCTGADCVTSLYPGGRYAVAAGTSMAAPHVSGVAALLLAQTPSRTRQQVLVRLLSTARPLAGAGAGVVDATAALGVVAMDPRRPVAVAPPAVGASGGAASGGATGRSAEQAPLPVAVPTRPAKRAAVAVPAPAAAPAARAASGAVSWPLAALAGALVGCTAVLVVAAIRNRR